MATALQTLIDAYIKRNANQEITGPVLNGVLTAISNALGTPFVGSDGYWYTYDAETGQFVKTDTPAQGETGPVGVTEAAATIDDQIGTPSVAVSLDGTRLDFAFRNLKGQKGDTGDAGITAAVVTVDAGIGTPSVDASITGTTLTLAFHNLKGETGAAAGFGTIEATVDDTTGTPAVVVTESGPDTAKNLSFAFSGLKGQKGDQGDTGVSADYPITIANNLTTDDPTAALAAYQGVVLKGEIDQLSQEVDEKIQLLQLEELPMAVHTSAWKNPTTMTHYVIPVNGGDSVSFDNISGTMYCAFLKSYTTPVLDATPDFCTGYVGRQTKPESSAFSLPTDCRFLIINNPNGNYALSSLKINGVEMMQGIRGGVSSIAKSVNDINGRVTTNENNIIGLKSSHTFVTCYTGASTVEKAIANDQVPQITVDKNLRLLVLFNSENSANDATLNINYVVKPLYYRGVRASSTNTWQAGDVLDLRYDETNERYMAEPWSGVALASEVQDSIKTSDLTYTITSDNIAIPDGVVTDYLVVDGGGISPANGWAMYKLPVTPGAILTVGGFYLGRSGYYAFYNGDTLVEYHGFVDPDGTTTPLTVTIPSSVTHFYFDIKSPLSPDNPYALLQINVGNSLLPYDTPTKEISEINGVKIAGSGNTETIPDLLADLPVSDGSDISTGYAFIDSSTGVVKVKMS